MTTLTIDDETAASLRERATRQGVSVEQYLRVVAERDPLVAIVDLAAGSKPKRPMTADEREQWWRDLTSGPAVPALPADFSTADIYRDHD